MTQQDHEMFWGECIREINKEPEFVCVGVFVCVRQVMMTQ